MSIISTTRPSHEFDAPDDEQLLERARAGDESAHAELYRRHLPAVTRYAAAIAAPADVDDIVAEGFARTMTAIGRGSGPSPDAFAAYVCVAARNYHRRLTRQRMSRSDREERAARAEVGPIDQIDDDVEFDDTLLTAFRDLPTRYQSVLWMLEVDGMALSDVGHAMQLPTRRVSKLRHRARGALRNRYVSERAQRWGTPRCRELAPELAEWMQRGDDLSSNPRVAEHVASCATCRASAAGLTDMPVSLLSLGLPVTFAATSTKGWVSTWLASRWEVIVGGTAAAGLVVAGVWWFQSSADAELPAVATTPAPIVSEATPSTVSPPSTVTRPSTEASEPTVPAVPAVSTPEPATVPAASAPVVTVAPPTLPPTTTAPPVTTGALRLRVDVDLTGDASADPIPAGANAAAEIAVPTATGAERVVVVQAGVPQDVEVPAGEGDLAVVLPAGFEPIGVAVVPLQDGRRGARIGYSVPAGGTGDAAVLLTPSRALDVGVAARQAGSSVVWDIRVGASAPTSGVVVDHVISLPRGANVVGSSLADGCGLTIDLDEARVRCDVGRVDGVVEVQIELEIAGSGDVGSTTLALHPRGAARTSPPVDLVLATP